MFCTNCGSPLPEGYAFCPKCGAKVEQASAQPQAGQPETVTPQAEQPVKDHTEPTDAPADAAQADDARQTPPQTEQQNVSAAASAAQPAAVQPGAAVGTMPRNRIGIWVAVAVAAVVVLVLAGVGVARLLAGNAGKNQVVYLADGSYELMKNLNKDPLEFATMREGDPNWVTVKFTQDGKYLYYFSKLDTDTSSGTLCRAELSKVRDRDDNSDASVIVDSNVRCYQFIVLSDGSVLYMDNDDNLKYFHDGQSVRIARDVNSVYDGRNISEDETRVSFLVDSKDPDKDDTLYTVALSDPENPVKLAEDVNYLVDGTHANRIVYTTYDSDSEVRSLYQVDYTGNAQQIATNVEWFGQQENELLYTASDGSKVNLYQYVDDPKASQDAGLSEPKSDQFVVPYYRYYSVYEDDDTSEYLGLYTSCSRHLRRLRNGWDSMEDVSKSTGDYYSAATKEAVKAFVDKYSQSEDEDGFIEVTDEVRSALQTINATFEDSTGNEWLELCFGKKQDGTTVDYEAYQAALETYNEAKDRIELREELQDPENQPDELTLYGFDMNSGTASALQEKLFSWSTVGYSMIGVGTVDKITGTIPLEEVETAGALKDRLWELVDQVPVYDEKNGNLALTISGDEISDISWLFVSGNSALALNKDMELLSAPVQNGVAGDFTLLADDARVDYQDESGNVFYYTNLYDNSEDDTTYGDCYIFNNGKSTRILQDTQVYSVSQYDDGTILAQTYRYDSREEKTLYEVNIIDSKGQSTLLDNRISQMFYLGKNKYLYLSDGDIYLYNGKEKERLAEDVDFMWYNYDYDENMPEVPVDGIRNIA